MRRNERNDLGLASGLEIEPLALHHDVDAFKSERTASQDYLRLHAFADQQARRARTYVATRGGRVVGYFTITAGSVEEARSAEGIAARQRRKVVPVVVVGRLALDVFESGTGDRRALLAEAMARCEGAAESIGARAIIVNAVDPRTRAFYLRHGLEAVPTSRFHLFKRVECAGA